MQRGALHTCFRGILLSLGPIWIHEPRLPCTQLIYKYNYLWLYVLVNGYGKEHYNCDLQVTSNLIYALTWALIYMQTKVGCISFINI